MPDTGAMRQARYKATAKGRATDARYDATEKGRARSQRYDRSRRRLDLVSIRAVDRTIAKYQEQLAPHQEGVPCH